jgi:DNA-binding CsgD family transcriptional regulator
MKVNSRSTTLRGLTPREREIMELATRDLTDKQIADTLDLSPATVNHHWRHILEKLGVHGRVAAVAHLLRRRHRLNKR